jgi:hypothetical protein
MTSPAVMQLLAAHLKVCLVFLFHIAGYFSALCGYF